MLTESENRAILLFELSTGACSAPQVQARVLTRRADTIRTVDSDPAISSFAAGCDELPSERAPPVHSYLEVPHGVLYPETHSNRFKKKKKKRNQASVPKPTVTVAESGRSPGDGDCRRLATKGPFSLCGLWTELVVGLSRTEFGLRVKTWYFLFYTCPIAANTCIFISSKIALPVRVMTHMGNHGLCCYRTSGSIDIWKVEHILATLALAHVFGLLGTACSPINFRAGFAFQHSYPLALQDLEQQGESRCEACGIAARSLPGVTSRDIPWAGGKRRLFMLIVRPLSSAFF